MNTADAIIGELNDKKQCHGSWHNLSPLQSEILGNITGIWTLGECKRNLYLSAHVA